jgi:hypothetical protein
MTDSVSANAPASSAPVALSFEQGVAAIAGILDEPENKPSPSKGNVQNAEKSRSAEASETSAEDGKANAEAPEIEADEAESPEDAEPDTDDTERETIELADDVEIELEEGKRVTLAELKAEFGKTQERVAGVQRASEQKLQEAAALRREAEDHGNRIIEQAQQLKQQRELLEAFAQAVMPQPPQMPNVSASDDPVAWSIYSEQKAQYDNFAQWANWFQGQKAEEARQAQEQFQREMPKRIETERSRLLELRPSLKDPKIAEQAKADIASVASKYGFPAEEVGTVTDSRIVNLLLDLADYHKIKAGLPAAKAKVQAAAPLVKATKRQAATDTKQKDFQKKVNNLRKTRSLGDLTAVLAEMDI